MTLPAFQTKRLVVKVRRNVVLNRISVVGAPGQLLCILSRPSGHAQLLLETIAGLRKPGSGQLEVLGGNPRSSCIRARLGLSLPPRLLDPEQFASDALRAVGRMKGLDRQELEQDIKELIDHLALHPLADERVAALPIADQQLLGIATAFLGNPALILLPGDHALQTASQQQALIQLMKDRAERGATIVLADEQFAARCDLLILLSKGELIGQAMPEMIRESVLGLFVAPKESNNPNAPHLHEPTFVEICQWILDHPAEMSARVRRWTVPNASP